MSNVLAFFCLAVSLLAHVVSVLMLVKGEWADMRELAGVISVVGWVALVAAVLMFKYSVL